MLVRGGFVLIKRDSRFELLRIISILMITVSHFSIYGNWSNLGSITPLETLKILSLDALGPIGAVIFFMITGFFISNKDLVQKIKKTRVKVRTVWGKTFFYSVSMLFISKLLGIAVPIKILVKCILPFTMNEYWFVTCYIIMILFSPFLDIVIKRINFKQHSYILAIFLGLMFVELVEDNIVNRLVLAFFSYFVGSYIRLYQDELSKVKNTILYIGIMILFSIDLLSIFLSRLIGISFGHSAHFTQYVLPVLISFCIFLIIVRVNSFTNDVINKLAPSTIVVYLITENAAFSHHMWANILNVGQYQDSAYFYLFALIITLLLYIACTIIDIFLVRLKNLVLALI